MMDDDRREETKPMVVYFKQEFNFHRRKFMSVVCVLTSLMMLEI